MALSDVLVVGGGVVGASVTVGEVTRDGCAPADRRETEFRLRAADAYGQWINVLRQRSGVPVTLKSGTLIVANICGKADLENIEAIFDQAVSFRQNVEWLDIGKEFEGLRPHRHHAPTKVLFLPNEKYVDARQLLCALHEAIAAIPSTSRQVSRVALFFTMIAK